MRLASGALWPIPITLDVSKKSVGDLGLKIGTTIGLRDPRDDALLATLEVSSIYRPDKAKEAEKVFGKNDMAHPSIQYLFGVIHDTYVGGKVTCVQMPQHYDYMANRCETCFLLS